MRRDSRSINQDLARMLVASYESNQKSIQSVSTSLASSQHELDNLDNTIPKHLEAPSLPLVRLQKEVDDCNGMIKQDTCAINKAQEQLNKLQVKHRTLELERQQLLDRRQHNVVACFLSMRISNEVGHI
ncbi:TPA: hypothetical protein ACH3X3_003255 [Trebouxia sp. C0006]